MSQNYDYGLFIGGYSKIVDGENNENIITNKYMAKFSNTFPTDSIDGIHGQGSIDAMVIWNDNLYLASNTYEEGGSVLTTYANVFNIQNNVIKQTIPKQTLFRIFSMAIYKDHLYTVGKTRATEDEYKSFVQRINTGKKIWYTIEVPEFSGTIYDIIIFKDVLYICGEKGEGDSSQPYIAKLVENDTIFEKINIGEKKGSLRCMTVFKDALYIGGSYADQIEVQQYVLKLEDNDAITVMSTGLHPNKGIINTITVYKDELYVGGSYANETKDKNYISKLKNNSFGENISDDIEGDILSIEVYEDNLYASGNFINEENKKIKENKYMSKYTGSSFTQIDKNQNFGGQISTLFAYEKDLKKKEKEDELDQTTTLIIGLVIGLGIPLIGVIIYYIMKKRRK